MCDEDGDDGGDKAGHESTRSLPHAPNVLAKGEWRRDGGWERREREKGRWRSQ